MSAQAQTLEEQVKVLAKQIGGEADKATDSREKQPWHTGYIPHIQHGESAVNEKGNGHGRKGICHNPAEAEAVISMIGNRISEHNERLEGF